MKTKFKITDEVYFMNSNKVTTGYVQGIHLTSCNFNPPKFKNILYNTPRYDVLANGLVMCKQESELFSSKQELIESL